MKNKSGHRASERWRSASARETHDVGIQEAQPTNAAAPAELYLGIRP
jgi:hypothetical protein